ncbi:uncharacterized protein LOC117342701 [Pecten maximus]|uniref:uncharacterized protein LOC117342701 n=1 Tax=Pecten maximus TaxID=6579 RepID=UPI00145910F8|nr:uncharacterized protein LOC117342701 [Pecten maximus]XP_033760805.1 uncharacterized protein LOC117342701 [Pecten maximus]XP_033760806.1 uncharacterized protein LOC117342701 [Pecten maximus]
MQNRLPSGRGNIRSRDHQIESDDCCVACCCCCCSIWLYLFCCRSMKRTLRVKLLWAYMMILGLTTGVVTGVVLFGSVDTEMSLSDMRIVDRKLSSVFCDNVDIESENFDSMFDAYFMKHKPTILPGIRETYNETYSKFIEEKSDVYKQFYLLTGSTVKITGQVDSYIELSLIRGQDNFDKYLDSDMQCIECVLEWRSMFKYGVENINFDIMDTDLYFFVFVSRLEDTWIDLHFRLRRTVYDTSQNIGYCPDATSCVFDFDMSTSETPVVLIHAKASNKQHFDVEPITIQTSCVGRSWLFVIIFFGLPTFLSIILSILIISRCSDPQPQQELPQNSRYPDERTPLLWDTIRAPAVVVLPPKYEDIVRADNNLPSYEEATSSNTSIQPSNVNIVVQQP